MSETKVALNRGTLTGEQIALLINQLGLELTFIDEQDICRFWTDVPDPIFERTGEILGTHVLDCHPEHTHDKIMTLLNDFRTGRKDHESHWSTSKARENRRVLVTYRAIRNESGEYKGCVEIVQDLEEIAQMSAI